MAVLLPKWQDYRKTPIKTPLQNRIFWVFKEINFLKLQNQ
jgi:hypothetical protein